MIINRDMKVLKNRGNTSGDKIKKLDVHIYKIIKPLTSMRNRTTSLIR